MTGPGERFRVQYRIAGTKNAALLRAKHICFEQTVEFPEELVGDGNIRKDIVGRIESFKAADKKSFKADISYGADVTGFELPQLLNVVFGNISLLPSIRVEALDLPSSILKCFSGPRFGIRGLRRLINVHGRPLLCTALKPLGKSASELAELAYLCARGGIDIIKDDHGLANQRYAFFNERVARCSRAVAKANRETGRRAIYCPHISAPADEIAGRALFAKKHGAGGLLIAPGLCGMSAMQKIAENDSIALPVIMHPAFLGSFVVNPASGISHGVMFGRFARLLGADATIYPNYGGRFSFTADECKDVAREANVKMGRLRPIFPCPGGGMTLERIPGMRKMYGNDVIFLVGGGLFAPGASIEENCRYFLKLITK